MKTNRNFFTTKNAKSAKMTKRKPFLSVFYAFSAVNSIPMKTPLKDFCPQITQNTQIQIPNFNHRGGEAQRIETLPEASASLAISVFSHLRYLRYLRANVSCLLYLLSLRLSVFASLR